VQLPGTNGDILSPDKFFISLNAPGYSIPQLGPYDELPSAFPVIQSRAQGILIRWDDAALGMTLQQSSSLSTPAWTDVTGSSKTNTVTLPADPAGSYFPFVTD
jgi:hypothetical protein